MEIKDALNLIQFILAIVMILVILMQSKGSSMGGIFGGESSSVYRTRRGFERRLFQFTIGLSVTFFLIAVINSMVRA
ncbi:MAG TPA: preprotein translocase subunit SecG [Chloroflexia bacterium]|nr:preprotein translocase subunit SecG [Chloroflexia bacterium]